MQIAAAAHLADRGFGKPKETVDKNVNLNMTRTDKLDISNLSEEQLDALEAALRHTNMLLIEGQRSEDESD